MPFAPRRARRRCCVTATSRPSTAATARPSRGSSRRCDPARPGGGRTGTRPSRRGTSTPAGRCARRCAGWGSPVEVRWRRRGHRARRVVLLVDVSGSMSAYADALLRLAHAYCAAGVPTEVFTLGTRLTHDHPAAAPARPRPRDRRRGGGDPRLVRRHPARPRASRSSSTAGAAGGWRAARSSSSSATGGSATSPRRSASRCAGCGAVAHRVVWVNPHRGRPGYEPVQGGIMAVLPHVDDFVAGHSMATFEELMEVVARA